VYGLPNETRCPRAFFERPVDDVAADLLGIYVLVRGVHGVRRARIVETEAYGGADDPASHAYRGSTPRTAVMFGLAGYLYVYKSYGLHWCMNVVTGTVGDASAVLLRAAQLEDDAPLRLTAESSLLLRGPGNLTRGLGITGADSGIDCCDPRSPRIAFIRRDDAIPESVSRSKRVGLTKGVDRLSRYYLEGHRAVSGPRTR
jgi:DNA-3-methyladenine glycosylase